MVLSKDEIIKLEILNSAQELFHKYGLKKTTMEDIAKHISKGKSTLYYYFSSKEDIFDAVIQKESDELFTETKSAIDAEDSAIDKLKIYCVTKVKKLHSLSNLSNRVKLEMLEIVKNSSCKAVMRDFEKREKEVIVDILNYGISTGEFNVKIKNSVDVVALMIFSILRGFLFDTHSYHIKMNKVEECICEVIDFLLNGIKKC